MDRNGFRNRMKQYKKAREENPGLKYWEWKDVPKYDGGTGSVGKIPWWQKIINHGEKVQPFTQTDIEQYKNNELQERLARSKYIMGVLSDIGASGKNPIKALYNPTTGGDQLDVFLLNTKDQAQIMEQRGWKKIDTKKEEDPYGIVRTGANYHLTKHDEVPVYENTFDSDTTITREQLTKLFNVSNDIIPGTDSFGNAGSYNSVIYIDKNTGKFYSRSYDLNDYGPTQLSNGFISTVGDFKRKAAEKLDEIGTPFVIRTGFVPLSYYDLQHIANQNPKYKEHINNAKASVEASKIQRKAEGGQVEPDPLEVLERSRPRVAGIPINDRSLSGTDPIGEAMMWGLGGRAASAALRSLFPTYGATLGWLAFGDNNKDNMLVVPNNPVKNTTPIKTGLLNKEVRQYYADDVLPRDILTSEADKLRFLNTDKNFEYDLYPSDYFKENVAGHYDPYADKIRLNGGYTANKDLLDNVMAHEVNHKYNREFPLDKEHNRILNRAYTVQPDLSTRAARAARKPSEKRATNVNIRHKLQTDLRNTLGHNPTKAEMDTFIDSLSDQELLDRLGSASSYGSTYLMSIEDRADLVNQPADQYKKARVTALRKALKRIAMNEDKNDNNQNYA